MCCHVRMTALARPVSALPAGTAFSRFIVALARAKGDPQAAASIAEHWRDAPHVHATFRAVIERAAVPGATTSDSAWAGALAQYGIGAEFICAHVQQQHPR